MKSLKHIVRRAVIAGLIVLGWGWVQNAEALGDPTDTMTITVEPDVTYAVDISSPFLAGYHFGLVQVGGTTVSTVAIQVANGGNIVEFFSLGVIDTTPGGMAWANNDVSLNPGTTSYVMQGQFFAAGSNQPLESSFSGTAKNIPSTPPLTAESRFNQGAGFAGKTAPGVAKDLWLQMKMPTAVYDSGVHTLVLSINGQGT